LRNINENDSHYHIDSDYFPGDNHGGFEVRSAESQKGGAVSSNAPLGLRGFSFAKLGVTSADVS
jgi:hypothetical protein